MSRMLLASWLVVLVARATPTGAGEVSGRVTMPDVCSPSVSPAVVTLAPAGGGVTPTDWASAGPAEVALVDQRGLQFVPRVRAIAPGQTVRFTNEDAETHNVHVGNDFNVSMSPGQPRSFTPARPGVYTLLCDVHAHMRGYLVVAASPWVQACTRQGRFRLKDVPDGRYVLNVWHEMGTPLRREVVVAGDGRVDLPTLALTVPAPSADAGTPGAVEPARPWTRVIEKIGMLLASSLDAASRPGGVKEARKL